MDLRAIAFDLDGTIYPEYRIVLPTVTLFVRHPKFIYSFNKVRKMIRKIPEIDNIRKTQAELMANLMKKSAQEAEKRIEEIIYRQWIDVMRIMKPYDGIKEIIVGLKERGYKTALLSDMPIEKKLKYLGLEEIWDCAFSSEDTNYLKPHPAPFLRLIDCLGVQPKQILYIGNNYNYDVLGARGLGIKTAFLSRCKKRNSVSDFHFKNYRELKHFLLSLAKNDYSL